MTKKQIKEKFIAAGGKIEKIILEGHKLTNYIIGNNNWRLPETTEGYQVLQDQIGACYIREEDIFNDEDFLRELKTIGDFSHKYNIGDTVYWKEYGLFQIGSIQRITLCDNPDDNQYFISGISCGLRENQITGTHIS